MEDIRFRKAGDARIPENSIGNHYKGRRTNIDLRGFTICDDLLDGTRANRKKRVLPILGFSSNA